MAVQLNNGKKRKLSDVRDDRLVHRLETLARACNANKQRLMKMEYEISQCDEIDAADRRDMKDVKAKLKALQELNAENIRTLKTMHRRWLLEETQLDNLPVTDLHNTVKRGDRYELKTVHLT